MLGSDQRKRLRPTLKSLGLSLIVCPSALYLGWSLFGYLFYAPLLASLAVALVIVWFRMRGLRSALPEPYGNGRVSTIDASAAARTGFLIILGGILLMVGVMGSFYFLPSEYMALFVLVFGLMAGLPLNEIVFFALVTGLERKSRSRIFAVTEETSESGRTVLVKTVELAPLPSPD
jgi:hypothetical protein